MQIILKAAHKKQQGVALITAVLIAALATIIAITMSSRLRFDTQRTANLLHQEQAFQYALAAEDWAQVELRKDDNNFDHYQENWAIELPPLPIDGGLITAKLVDLQGRINLNNVQEQSVTTWLQALQQQLKLENDFTAALKDWIDADSERLPNGGEDFDYMSGEPSYRTANHAISHNSELLLLKQLSTEEFDRINPHVFSLPEGQSSININTASSEVLSVVLGNLEAGNLEKILSIREESPFEDMQEFLDLDELEGKTISADGLTVSSQYFLLTVDVILGDARLTLQSVIKREQQKTVINSRRIGPPRERLLITEQQESEDDSTTNQL